MIEFNVKKILGLFLWCLHDVSVACSIIDIDILVVSPNHEATLGIPTAFNFTFVCEKKKIAKLFQDLLQTICGCVVRRKIICEWMFEESITLPEGQQLCVFPSQRGIQYAWVCQGLYICMCVFFSVCGFPGSGNSVSCVRLLLSN